MSAGRSHVCAGDYVIIRLPNGMLRPIEVQPNNTINIGKYGAFQSNSILGRPYHLTYELLDKADTDKFARLRVVSAAEVNSEGLATDVNGEEENSEERDSFDLVGENGDILMRDNRLTVDDPSRQALSVSEIEELKRAGASGKEIIAKIMAAHSALSEKTTFSLAKYTLRKTRKFLKRFTVLPLDVGALVEFMIEKDAARIMDLRMESLGLIGSWANVHHAGNEGEESRGRYLVVDDTGGLLVAAMAERMGILYPLRHSSRSKQTERKEEEDEESLSQPAAVRRYNVRDFHQSATSNSITMVHPHTQPNISLLKYFGFNSEDMPLNHPLYTNLRTLTWLQLLDPTADATYTDPPPDVPDAEFESWKSSKRGTHYRKVRRHERTRRVVDETRKGEFDGLVVASFMKPDGILKHLVPLVKGGGQIVVYNPSVEPLTELADLYSRERRGAYVKLLHEKILAGDTSPIVNDEDFPVNPTLLLHPLLQTARAIHWQVLPGRTHPMMTSRGGPEGYIFHATRVIPSEGVVNARGKYGKKRKADAIETPPAPATPVK